MDEVIAGLFIGPQEIATPANLLQNGITAVVSVGCEDVRDTLSLEDNARINYLCFPHILDTPEEIILHIFARTTAFIAIQLEQKRSVLVHCIYGQSRSAAVVAAFLISQGYKLSEALTLLKSRHDNICINPGFLSQVRVSCILKPFVDLKVALVVIMLVVIM